MLFKIESVCLCKTGKIRENNEDNFYFDGSCLEAENRGLEHPLKMKKLLLRNLCVAVFDGMGGENYGEFAAFSAAKHMQSVALKRDSFFDPKEMFLHKLCERVNAAVVEEAKELCTARMGSTMAALCFSCGCVYACNLGDSRAYRLRDGELLQLSKDHVERREGQQRKKAPLTQHLGIDPETFMIEPYITGSRLKHGDQYLLCSDGLTDMLNDLEIREIMCDTPTMEECAQKLVDAALEKGGRDNVTVIVCRILK